MGVVELVETTHPTTDIVDTRSLTTLSETTLRSLLKRPTHTLVVLAKQRVNLGRNP